MNERGVRAERGEVKFDFGVEGLAAPEWLARDLAAMGIELEAGEAERLGRFVAMLLAANRVVNLTAITGSEEAWRKHVFDALTLMPVLAELEEGSGVADVGSGGGVPAIPLAVCMPGLRFTLIEATGKKAAFLRGAIGALGVSNAEVLHERAEETGRRWKGEGSGTECRATRESFDAVVARALGRMRVAVELTVPLAKPGGIVVLVKGAKAEEELAEASGAIGVLGARHATTIATPTGRLVVLEKVSRTPRVYPRVAGEPKRKPLGGRR
jgi:16S rRNA (guanine527-N7)-methyltransferase